MKSSKLVLALVAALSSTLFVLPSAHAANSASVVSAAGSLGTKFPMILSDRDGDHDGDGDDCPRSRPHCDDDHDGDDHGDRD